MAQLVSFIGQSIGQVSFSEEILRPYRVVPEMFEMGAYQIAELMIETYRETFEYNGESLEDAIGEIQYYLAGKRGARPLS